MKDNIKNDNTETVYMSYTDFKWSDEFKRMVPFIKIVKIAEYKCDKM